MTNIKCFGINNRNLISTKHGLYDKQRSTIESPKVGFHGMVTN